MAELRSPSTPPCTPPSQPRSRVCVLRLAIFALAASLFGCDHATKIAAKAALAGGRAVPLYDGLVELRFVPNDDTAFGFLRAFGVTRSPGLLLAMSCVALGAVAVAWIAARRRARLVQHVGFAIIFAGALGNVVDRALRGYVVDFIHVSHWPVFNVADIAVVAGVALLVLGRQKPRPEAPLASPS